MKLSAAYYAGKRVLITGHTGFKGTWMCRLLAGMGARVTGYALEPPTEPSLFALCGAEKEIDSRRGDIRDLEGLMRVFGETRPEIVIHMAAQPIVRESYRDPVGTYGTNVMGTVNVLEAVRQTESVRSFVNVTTDKVYLNREWAWGYRENEELNGFDPYSNSKSCSELVTGSYRNAFFGGDAGRRESGQPIAVTTCRAGNVIGGGDFASDRIIPDCVRAIQRGEDIVVRNPHSTRPYQHVLEPVAAYLMIAAEQDGRPELAGSYNVGPEDRDCRTTGELVTLFCETWNRTAREKAPGRFRELAWINRSDGGPHEANFLKLDCSKIRSVFGWKPAWGVEEDMDKIAEWTLAYLTGGDVRGVMDEQIAAYLAKIGG